MFIRRDISSDDHGKDYLPNPNDHYYSQLRYAGSLDHIPIFLTRFKYLWVGPGDTKIMCEELVKFYNQELEKI